MEHQDHDKVFFVNFGIVLAALGGLFFVCIVAARTLVLDKGVDPDEAKALAQRIAPVGQVITDPAALVAMQSSKPKRAAYSGDEVVAKICGNCHQAGVLGAPKIGEKSAWAPRLASDGGLDGLEANAIKGKGSMPPRGGAADLTDDEIKAAIGVMLKSSGV